MTGGAPGPDAAPATGGRPVWILGSGNRHKYDELAALLAGATSSCGRCPPASPCPRRPAPRCSPTPASRRGRSPRRTGALALADDTGLEVDALGGEPGVLSARYAGETSPTPTTTRLLLERLRGIHGANRAGALPLRAGAGRCPAAARSRPRARSRASSSTSRAARRASATTPCSCPRAAGAASPSSRPPRRTRSRTGRAPPSALREPAQAGALGAVSPTGVVVAPTPPKRTPPRSPGAASFAMGWMTGLEPATPGTTIRCSAN